MSLTITLVGGPMDGQDMMIPNSSPPLAYRALQHDWDVTNYLRSELSSSYVLIYDLVLDVTGHPSRNDEGFYRYQYRHRYTRT